MSKTKQPPAPKPIDPHHPMEIARQEKLRGDRRELAPMRDAIMHGFGIVIDLQRLEPEESGELLALHKAATRHEGWEVPGRRHYGLSRLSKTEHARWRTLVSKAAGREGLLDDLDEDASTASKIEALVRRAMAPGPSSMLAPEGAAVLPAGVVDDLVAGKLFGVDVAVLGVVVAMFASTKLHPHAMKRRDVAWTGDGETLLVSGYLYRLLPSWDSENGLFLGDAASKRITQRLTEAGWLDIETGDRGLLKVRLGKRLVEAGR
jgi:hypothetical protein